MTIDLRVQKLLIRRCVYHSDKSYSFFSHREFEIGYQLLRVLEKLRGDKSVFVGGKEYGRRGVIQWGHLFILVKGRFDKRLIKICAAYNNDAAALRASPYKWVTVKSKKGTKESLTSFLGQSALRTVLWRLVPAFIYVVEKASKKNQMKRIKPYYQIRINKHGRELLGEWRKLDRKIVAVDANGLGGAG